MSRARTLALSQEARQKRDEYYGAWAQRNAARLKDYHANYYQAHKATWGKGDPAKRRARWARRSADINRRRRAAHAASPERLRNYWRAWRQRNQTKKQARDAVWRRNNPEKYLAAIARAKAANPELYRALAVGRAGRRRARLRMAGTEQVDISRIYARDRWTCHLCHRRVGRESASLDHLIPVSRNGPWAEWNLALAHFDCNRARRDRQILEREDRQAAEAYLRAAA